MTFNAIVGMFVLAVASMAAGAGDTLWCLTLLLCAAAQGVIIVFELTDRF